jgi:hypothetical protein
MLANMRLDQNNKLLYKLYKTSERVLDLLYIFLIEYKLLKGIIGLPYRDNTVIL